MLQAETHFLTDPVPLHEHDVPVHQNIFLILILRCFYPVRYLFTLFYPLIPVSHIPAFFLIQQCRISGKIRGIVCMRHSVIDHGQILFSRISRILSSLRSIWRTAFSYSLRYSFFFSLSVNSILLPPISSHRRLSLLHGTGVEKDFRD